jgi:hypothetical protein
MRRVASRRKAKGFGVKFGEPSNAGEKSGGGVEYPLRAANNNDGSDSDSDGPPGRPSRPDMPQSLGEDAGSKIDNRPRMKTSRSKVR